MQKYWRAGEELAFRGHARPAEPQKLLCEFHPDRPDHPDKARVSAAFRSIRYSTHPDRTWNLDVGERAACAGHVGRVVSQLAKAVKRSALPRQ
jgi:hypothetical protein